MSDPAYVALALQVTCRFTKDAPDPQAARLATIARLDGQIAASKAFIGPDLRLVVLPEYFLTGFPIGASVAEWAAHGAIAMDGAEYAALGRVASDGGLFLSGNAYERDPHFPGLHFQTSFVIAPDGGVILRYRRLISLFAPSPFDVLDRYVGVYGSDALLPVARTEIGALACVASEEVLYPEIARILALRGAEVLLHSSSEVASALDTPKNVAKQARAIENLAYVVSANSAGLEGVSIPSASTDGCSRIVDHHGRVLAAAAQGESMAAFAEIDLAALRRWRLRGGMANTLSRLPTPLFAQAYAAAPGQAANSLEGVEAPGPAFFRDRQRRAIEALANRPDKTTLAPSPPG